MINNFFSFFNTRERKNLISSLSNISIQTLTQFFFPPLMILIWGADLFGIWIFLISIPSIFILFNIQFNDAAIQQIAIHQSRNENKKANIYFSNSIIFVIFNLLIFNGLILFYFFYFDKDFNVLKNFNKSELKIILILLISSVNLKIIESIFHTGIYSQGKLNILFNLSSYYDLLSKLLIVFLGYIYTSLIYASIVILLLSLISLLVHIYYFSSFNKFLKFSLKKLSKKIIKKIFVLSIGHNAQKISFLLKQAGLIIIIGKFFDPYIVAYVSTTFTLFYYFPKRLFGRISNIYIFEFAHLFGKRNKELLKTKLIFFLKYNLIFITIFSMFSIFLGPLIYEIWTNNNYQIIYLLFLLVIADSFIEVVKVSIFTIFKSLNNFIQLGVIDMFISSFGFIIFYLSLELEFLISFSSSYIFVALGNILVLIISILMFYKFYKSNFKIHK